ncbi:MAG: hypothetical protein ABI131_02470 [Nostocoides sp.]
MNTIESQLRSVLAEEAQRTPTSAGLVERVRADAVRGRRHRQVRRVGLVAALAAAVTGIAVLPPLLRGPTIRPGIASSDSPATASAAATAAGALCPTQNDPLSDPGHVPPNLGPVTAAFTCWTGTHDVPGDGTWTFREVRRVTGGLDATLRAYAVPDAPAGSGAALSIGYTRRVLILEVGGHFIAAREPILASRAPLKSAVAAYEAMETSVVVSVRGTQIESPLSRVSGCPLTVKDTIALLAGQPITHAPAGPPTLPADVSVTACFYSSTPDLDGTLTAATRLTADEYDQVRALVSAATADATCATTSHTRFTVLSGNAVPWTEIALDGCGVDQGHGALRGADELQTLLVTALTHQLSVP